jgi:hypothetical protein
MSPEGNAQPEQPDGPAQQLLHCEGEPWLEGRPRREGMERDADDEGDDHDGQRQPAAGRLPQQGLGEDGRDPDARGQDEARHEQARRGQGVDGHAGLPGACSKTARRAWPVSRISRSAKPRSTRICRETRLFSRVTAMTGCMFCVSANRRTAIAPSLV